MALFRQRWLVFITIPEKLRCFTEPPGSQTDLSVCCSFYFLPPGCIESVSVRQKPVFMRKHFHVAPEHWGRLIYPGCTCLVNLGAGTLSERRPPAVVFCRKSGEVLHMEGIIHDYSSINRRRGWKRICGRTPSYPPPLLCLHFFPVFSGWFSHVCIAAVVQHHNVIRVQPVAELVLSLHSIWNLSSGDMSYVHMTWCIAT